jgi:hypothetical protein
VPSVLAETRRFLFPRPLADHCYRALREAGEQGSELFIALSATTDDTGHHAWFRRALVPEQTCHRTPDGLLVTIDEASVRELGRVCFEAGELLAGQIHAHPGRAYHSGADNALALVQAPGGLSIVVPDFARGPLRPRRWSVYQLRPDGSWRPPPRRVKVELE